MRAAADGCLLVVVSVLVIGLALCPPSVAFLKPRKQCHHGSDGSERDNKTKIAYHGGPLVTSISVYLIYYGKWSLDAKVLVENFLHSLNDNIVPYSVASWWAITLQYYQRIGILRLRKKFVGQKVCRFILTRLFTLNSNPCTCKHRKPMLHNHNLTIP